MSQNRRVILTRRPGADKPVTPECFEVKADPVNPDAPNQRYAHTFALEDGSTMTVVKFALQADQDGNEAIKAGSVSPPLPPGCIIAKTLWLSVDPYMRCQFNEDSGVGYAQPFQPGEMIHSAGIGQVVFSTAESHPVGTLVGGATLNWHWQEFNVFAASSETFALPLPLPPILKADSAHLALGALGLTGLTGYFGIIKDAKITPGCTVVVSSAAGATGSVAAQVAKLQGAGRVIGLTSSDAKCAAIKSTFKLDEAINYKSAMGSDGTDAEKQKRLEQAVMQATGGKPVDVYFDNVGGVISDAVIQCLAEEARVVLCGQISTYDTDVPYPPPLPKATEEALEAKKVVRKRYLVLEHAAEFSPALIQLAQWVAEGKIYAECTKVDGLEKAPEAFISMMRGENVGKMIVRVL